MQGSYLPSIKLIVIVSNRFEDINSDVISAKALCHGDSKKVQLWTNC